MDENRGMLYDHSGKRSNSRVIAFLSGLAVCVIAVGVAALEWDEPSQWLLGILAGGMLGPIGMNRYFGELGAAKYKGDN